MKYNFSALTSIVTTADILELKQLYGRTLPKIKPFKMSRFVAWVCSFLFINTQLALFLPRVIDNSSIVYCLCILVSITILLIIILYIINSRKKRWQQNVRLYKFSKDNELDFALKLDPFFHEGVIFNTGDDRIATSVLSEKNAKFEIANYSYSETTYYTDTPSTSYYHYGYMMIQLTKKLPHIILDSKANNRKLFNSVLPRSFDVDQKLSLEGDFDKYFTLYVPKGYERDALYVFTPDIMALFIDHSSEFDAEIIGDKLYIYSLRYFDFRNIVSIQQLFNIISKIGLAVINNTNNYVDTTVKNKK